MKTVMTRDVAFKDGEFYHIYNRGVERRTIFLGYRDYERFLRALDLFNDQAIVSNFARLLDVQGETSNNTKVSLIDIVCFCLMPNHFHLLVRQRGEDGITKFMRKLGTGYTMYFNKKNHRTGVLFEGAFKAVHVDADEQLNHLPRYIHLNPLELIERGWKGQGVKHWERASTFLQQYPWSSYTHFLGTRGYGSILNTGLISQYFDEGEAHAKSLRQWVASRRVLDGKLTFE